jgi:ABC-type uncharacterized transport system permease subunit
MKKRRLSNVFFGLLGLGILGFLILSVIGSQDNERNSFVRQHERMSSLDGRMMEYHGHHHSFEILPILFVLVILFLAVWFIYRRFRKQQSDFIGNSSFIGEAPLSSPIYNKADFLDEWEKNIKPEDKKDGYI